VRLLLSCCLLLPLSVHALDVDGAQMLDRHNHWRKRVSVPPLQYSEKLATASQRWAEHLKHSNHCRMQHSRPDKQYGENLYWASAIKWSDGKLERQQVSPVQVVDSWAAERSDYDYKNNRCETGKMCGHYTQVVWRTTTLVGCGAAVCEDTQEQVWVCRYQAPGNWLGERPY